ncbi:MAG: hypothetical protein IKE76_08200, partial [Clostridia bacterium]|nr:hypothetical protein [Clostridia bacterium]
MVILLRFHRLAGRFSSYYLHIKIKRKSCYLRCSIKVIYKITLRVIMSNQIVTVCYGVIDVIVLLVRLPEIVHRHPAGVGQYAHIRDAFLTALFLYGIVPPL